MSDDHSRIPIASGNMRGTHSVTHVRKRRSADSVFVDNDYAAKAKMPLTQPYAFQSFCDVMNIFVSPKRNTLHIYDARKGKSQHEPIATIKPKETNVQISVVHWSPANAHLKQAAFKGMTEALRYIKRTYFGA